MQFVSCQKLEIPIVRKFLRPTQTAPDGAIGPRFHSVHTITVTGVDLPYVQTDRAVDGIEFLQFASVSTRNCTTLLVDSLMPFRWAH